jgi:thioredoxin reductase
MKKLILLSVSLVMVMGLAQAAPKYYSKKELMKKMAAQTKALGVNCNYCHVGKQSNSLDNYKPKTQKERDTLTRKRVAVAMIGVTKKLKELTGKDISCMDCHKGKAIPAVK